MTFPKSANKHTAFPSGGVERLLTAPASATPKQSDLFRVLRTPQDPIGHHPSVGEIHVALKFYGNHLVIGLDDHAREPTLHPLAGIVVVVAIDFDRVAHIKNAGVLRFFRENDFARHSTSKP